MNLIDNYINAGSEYQKIIYSTFVKYSKNTPDIAIPEEKWKSLIEITRKRIDKAKEVVEICEKKIKETEDTINEIASVVDPNESHLEAMDDLDNNSELAIAMINKQTYEETYDNIKKELEVFEDIYNNALIKNDALKQNMIRSNIIMNIIDSVLSDEEMYAHFKKDYIYISEVAEKENMTKWQVILKGMCHDKIKTELLEFQHEHNKTEAYLKELHDLYIGTRVNETIPEVNWEGLSVEERYGEHDKVVSVLKTELESHYIRNQRKLSNEELKGIRDLLIRINDMLLNVNTREFAILKLGALADPISKHGKAVTTIIKNFSEKKYPNLGDTALDFMLYTMLIIVDVESIWRIFLLA